MQPTYDSKELERAHSLVKNKPEKWNPVCEAPNSRGFFREINESKMERYPGRLALSEALVSEMQKKGSKFKSDLEEDTEYKSLYGEKNPNKT